MHAEKNYKSVLPLKVLLLNFKEMVANYGVPQRGPGSILDPRKGTPWEHPLACMAGGAGVQERTVFFFFFSLFTYFERERERVRERENPKQAPHCQHEA